MEDKEFVALVGPSGCGKTTAPRMIAGLEEITKGKLYIGGRPVNDVAPKDRDLAMVFQNMELGEECGKIHVFDSETEPVICN